MADWNLIRASDADRQQVVDRLHVALQEGRLKLEEFTERVGLAYQAVTYGDLSRLVADLPAVRPQAALAPAVHRSAFADLPGPLKVLWVIWLAAVKINLIIWVLLVLDTGYLRYPWPLWVAVPSGAALLAVSAPVVRSKRGKRRTAVAPAAVPLPPPPPPAH